MSRVVSPAEIAKNRAKKIKRAIELLDSLRARQIYNATEVLKIFTELGYEGEIWEKTKDIVYDIAVLPTKHEDYPKLKSYDNIASKLLLFSFIGLIVSTVMTFMNYEPYLTFIIITITLITVNISYLLKLYISSKLRRIYSQADIEKYDEDFKKAINLLIARLRGELKKAKIPVENVELKLYFDDYTGIKILRTKKKLYFVTLK